MNSQLNVLYPKRAMSAGSPVASQSLAVSSLAVSPVGYTADTAGGAGVSLVTFDVQTGAVYVRWDGTDPTSSTGHLLPVGGGYTWNVSQFNNARFIRATVDAIVFVSPMNP